MKAVKVGTESGLEHLQVADLPDPGAASHGEIRVRVHATSLNYHDYRVAKRGGPKHIGRILMADGAGVVEAVGEGVTEFTVGDHVVSTFFPRWLDAGPAAGDFSIVPGDSVDGYACEVVVRPSSWFTHAPKGFSHVEAATLTTAGLTAWRALVGDGLLKAGDTVLTLGTGGVSIFALQIAKAMGAAVLVTSSSDEKL
jgi:NADPH:quinone reductase-like Zn-dependent oxidoreductase